MIKMKNKNKIILPIVIVWVLAIIACGYSGSFALLKMAGLSTDSLAWKTFYETYQFYGEQAAYKKFMLVGWIGTAIPLVIALLLSIAMFFSLKEKIFLYGNARFANAQDLTKSGFFPTEQQRKKQKYPALLIGKMTQGKYKGSYIYYAGQQFLMMYAPTRSGKGVGIVIPNCIYYDESLCVLDIKLENYLLTAGYREKILKQDVFLFCPDGYAQKILGETKLTTHRWNPLFYIRRGGVYRFGDLEKIATILFPLKGGENDTWTDASKSVFMSLVLYLLDVEEEKKHKVNMNAVLKLSVPTGGENLAKWFESEIKSRNNKENLAKWQQYYALSESEKIGNTPERYPLSVDTIRLFRDFCAKESKQQQSVMLDFKNVMAMFANPVCAAATEDNDFDLRDVRRKRMTVYFGLSPSALSQYAKLTNLFFSQLLNENVRTLPEHDPTLKYQCTLMLDEFTSMGRLDVVQIALAFTAGYNMRFVFILQNEEQLFDDKKGYGRNGGLTILKNCAVKLFYPPKEIDESVKTLSESLGYYDLVRNEISVTSGKNSSKTRNKRIEKRALMLPQEITELNDIKHKSGMALPEIIISEFSRPFIAHKIVSFEDKFFVKAKHFAKNNQPVLPVLDIQQDEVVRQLHLQRERNQRWQVEKQNTVLN
ncbi:conjugal transfer protein TraG [Arsenophonus sp. ENCA]|nr:conjugal transfer protein TraG [Arsenophonus sp. ENCA]